MDISSRVKKQYEKYPFPRDEDILDFDSILTMIKELNLKGKTVLDVGCGIGIYSCAFAKLGFKVKAIDFSKTSLNIAKKKAKEMNLEIDFEYNDLFKYDDSKKYDIVFCWGVLHHTKNAKKGFKKIARFVSPRGFLVINIFNSNYYNMRFARWLANFGGYSIEDKLRFVKSHKKMFLFLVFLWKYKNHMDMSDITLVDLYCHENARYFSKKEVLKWFEDIGFKVINSKIFFQENYIGVRK